MTKFWRWLKSLFIKEYQVTIWVDPLKKTEYFFRTINKVSPTYIKGNKKDCNTELFELHTQDKFNYQIVEKEPCWD